MKDAVRVFEVGPRDGLQNEPRPVSLAVKLRFVSGLVQAGVRDLELGSFVRADRVPAMADTPELYRAIREGRLALRGARAWALVPNRRGLRSALKAGVRHVAVFTAATDSFARRNIGMTVADSLKEFGALIREARERGEAVRVRGYVSTAFGCPYEGRVRPRAALRVVEKLAALGVEQVSIGDTIGVGTPNQVDELFGPALRLLGAARVAAHFHDTRGTALANALRALELGVRTIDSAAGGLGGCPFAPGAAGNLATEDLVYLLDGMGLRSGIDLEALCRTSLELARAMKRSPTGRYLQAFTASCGAPRGRHDFSGAGT
ncbi:MAG: hydroxymethylglutaryl-CoA lyase [Oligoflexia bacterium]|nr:hydroxymethylglutaryl-CoA lyase [Oligoflexia bacterium]